MTRHRPLILDMPAEDEWPPQPGDYVLTARHAYQVTGARPVDSRVWCNRWTLDVEFVGLRTARPELDRSFDLGLMWEGGRVFTSTRYARGETPAMAFGAAA